MLSSHLGRIQENQINIFQNLQFKLLVSAEAQNLNEKNTFKVPLNLLIITFGFLKKWVILGLFLFIFDLFKQTLLILQQINVKKCLSSIRCRHLNSQPSNFESPPLTTRPGLPSNY